MGASSHLGSIRLGKIFGIPLSINYSWLLIFGLLFFLLSTRFSDFYPYWSATQIWGNGGSHGGSFLPVGLGPRAFPQFGSGQPGYPGAGYHAFIFGGVSQLAHELSVP